MKRGTSSVYLLLVLFLAVAIAVFFIPKMMTGQVINEEDIELLLTQGDLESAGCFNTFVDSSYNPEYCQNNLATDECVGWARQPGTLGPNDLGRCEKRATISEALSCMRTVDSQEELSDLNLTQIAFSEGFGIQCIQPEGADKTCLLGARTDFCCPDIVGSLEDAGSNNPSDNKLINKPHLLDENFDGGALCCPGGIFDGGKKIVKGSEGGDYCCMDLQSISSDGSKKINNFGYYQESGQECCPVYGGTKLLTHEECTVCPGDASNYQKAGKKETCGCYDPKGGNDNAKVAREIISGSLSCLDDQCKISSVCRTGSRLHSIGKAVDVVCSALPNDGNPETDENERNKARLKEMCSCGSGTCQIHIDDKGKGWNCEGSRLGGTQDPDFEFNELWFAAGGAHVHCFTE